MDVNFTSPVAANVILTQSLWIPALNLAIGLIGALIGSSAVYFVAHYEKEQEMKILHREERKQAYINFLSNMFYLHQRYRLGETPEKRDMRDFFRFSGQVKLLGSPEIIRAAIITNPQDLADPKKMIPYGDNLIRLMAKELQEFDVYKRIAEINPMEP